MLERSASAQHEVTDRLGFQTRNAIEILVQTIDRIDKDRGRKLLAGTSEKGLYEASLSVMMRLIFLLSAEERELLLLGDETWDRHYAVSTLRAQLREEADQKGEEILETRFDAWARLLATFRAVHSGVRHDLMVLEAYGGSLFDPDRYPFLEGRAAGTSWRSTPASPLPIDNRTVLHLLEALQLLRIKASGAGFETRLLSFRSLDIEQIGHVYEGLLDHTAKRAEAPMLGLTGAKDLEPEIALDNLEQRFARGIDPFVTFLHEETGRSESTLRKAMATPLPTPGDLDEQQSQRLLRACANDEALAVRVLPFYRVLRLDTHDLPVVITTGSVYVTSGDDRRSTGTHYTPRSLTEPVVQYALEPIVYDGVAEGKPKAEWRLRRASEIVELKVCDIAMGSGAFLVQACRYLSERLVEAWEEVERENPGKIVIAPEGTLSEARIDDCPIPQDAGERLIVARRIVADRCLYGVDVNPMAVEMAKLSLWLATMQKNRPFTFLDHALRCGDSLLGVTSLDQITYFNLDPSRGKQIPFGGPWLREQLGSALEHRREIESFTVADIEDQERKAALLAKADEELERVKLIGDLLIGWSLEQLRKKGKSDDEEIMGIFSLLNDARFKTTDEQQEMAEKMLEGRRPFHWALEFPEVFVPELAKGSVELDAVIKEARSDGFDAIVGNPPFMGGQKITGNLGDDYREFLVANLGKGKRGSADLCAYFFLESCLSASA